MATPRVPFIDLTRVIERVHAQVTPRWSEALANAEFIGGEAVKTLERELAAALGTKHALCCANGTDALVLALYGAGIRANMKVAIPNLTFWACFEAVDKIGALPVLVDIDPADLQMSIDELQQAHEKFGLDAVMLVHLFGHTSARLSELRAYCADQELPLIEDGAQAFGVKSGGAHVFSGAYVSTLSFYPAKVLGGCMDGGAVLTNDADLIERCRSLANHGRSDHYAHAYSGWNSRMGAMQAIYISRVLPLAGEMIASRREALARYRAALEQDPACRAALTWHLPHESVEENGYLTVLSVNEGNASGLDSALRERGIECRRTYPETISAQPPARDALRASRLKVSSEFCEKVLNLPLFAWMTDVEISRAVEELSGVLSAR